MGIASGVKEMTQDITSSYDERAKRVGEIKEEAEQVVGEAQDLIKGFQASRKQTGAQLRRDLAQGKAGRKSEVKGMLTGFKKSRREESAQTRKDLAQGVAQRRSDVKEITEDAQQTIKGFRLYRKGMSMELRKELGRSRSDTKSEVDALLKDAQKLVKDSQKAREEAGDELRKYLAKGRADRESEVREMRGDFHKAQAEVRADLKEAATAWQELARTMKAKRAGVKVPPKVEAPVKEKVGAPIAEEVEVAEAPGTKEIPHLEARLSAMINLHPEGITLAEVAEKFGVAPVVLGRAARSLVDKGKIRKEEKLYFPVASE
jgi:uncharacterized protein YicC (UPF0701 family)